MKIQLVKTPMGLKPISDEDAQRLKKIEDGEIVEVDVKIPRNLKLHRKYFALLDLMWENDRLQLPKTLYRKEMQLAAGHYDEYVGYNGEIRKEPHSISFAKMEQHIFDELFSDMLNIACIRLGVEDGTIKEELKYTLGKFY